MKPNTYFEDNQHSFLKILFLFIASVFILVSSWMLYTAALRYLDIQRMKESGITILGTVAKEHHLTKGVHDYYSYEITYTDRKDSTHTIYTVQSDERTYTVDDKVEIIYLQSKTEHIHMIANQAEDDLFSTFLFTLLFILGGIYAVYYSLSKQNEPIESKPTSAWLKWLHSAKKKKGE